MTSKQTAQDDLDSFLSQHVVPRDLAGRSQQDYEDIAEDVARKPFFSGKKRIATYLLAGVASLAFLASVLYSSPSQTKEIQTAVAKTEIVAPKKKPKVPSCFGKKECYVLNSDADKNFARVASSVDGKVWVGKLPSNGNRDVAVIVPKKYDQSKPGELIFYFHGTRSQMIKAPKETYIRDQKRCLRAVKYYAKKHEVGLSRLEQVLCGLDAATYVQVRNVILVYPLSAGARGLKNSVAVNNGYDFDWMRPDKTKPKDQQEGLDNLYSQVMGVLHNQLGVWPSGFKEITLKCHSAGGKACENAVTYARIVPVDRVDFWDASYGFWAQVCYRAAIKNNKNVKFKLVLKRGTETHRCAKSDSLLSQPGVSYVFTNYAHGHIPGRYFTM